jgi:hypothetical protein
VNCCDTTPAGSRWCTRTNQVVLLSDRGDKWHVGRVGLEDAAHEDFGSGCFLEVLRDFHMPPLPPHASLMQELSAHELAFACQLVRMLLECNTKVFDAPLILQVHL